MADNPLVQFAADALAQAQAGQKTAQDAIAAAQADLKTKVTATSAASLNLKTLQQRVSDIRAQLAASATADDGDALVAQLRQAILDARAAQAAVLSAGDAAANSTAAAAKAAARAGAAGARAANATPALAQAKLQAAPRDSLRETAGRPPLSTIADDATAALAADPFLKAEARIEADLPAKLLERARAGAASESARLERARASAADAEGAAADATSPVDTQTLVLTRAVDGLRNYVQTAKAAFDQAQATLARVADPNQAKLTADEVKSIQSKKADGSDNVALAAARNDAADLSMAVVSKQQDVDGAQAAVNKARFKARAKGLDDAGVEADPTVIAAEAALKAAGTALAAAAVAFTPEIQQTLAAWAAAVPDANWQLFADHEAARATLTRLSTTDPASLVKAVTDAENVLVAALQLAGKGPAILEFIRAEGAGSASLLQAAADINQRRVLSALRCDF